MTTPATDSPEAQPSEDGDGGAVDLMRGWDWANLILPGVEKHLGTSGKTPEEAAAGIAEELKPLTELIDRTLANRADEATIEERVMALERKILLLRNAHDILIGLAIARTEQLRDVVRDGRLGSQPRAARTRRSPKVDETAHLIARRRRLLGQ